MWPLCVESGTCATFAQANLAKFGDRDVDKAHEHCVSVANNNNNVARFTRLRVGRMLYLRFRAEHGPKKSVGRIDVAASCKEPQMFARNATK